MIADESDPLGVTLAVGAAVVVVVAVFYHYIMPRFKYASLSKVAQPVKPFAVTRVLNDEEATLRAHLVGMARKNKFYLSWNCTAWPTIYVSNVALIEQVLRTEQLPSGREQRFLKAWIGKGVSTLTSDEWRERRNVMREAFHDKLLRKYLRVVNERCSEMLRHWGERNNRSAPVDIRDWSSRLCADIITLTSCSYPLDSINKPGVEYYRTLNETYELLNKRLFQADLALSYDSVYALTGDGRRFRKNCKTLRRMARIGVNKRRTGNKRTTKSFLNKSKRVRSIDSSTDEDGEQIDLLEYLSASPDIDDNQIVDELCGTILQGHRPTASAVMWTLYLIAQHVAVEERVLEEVNRLMGSRDTPTYADLKGMTYLSMVLKESMRLYPPVASIERQLTQSTDLNGVEVRSGVDLCILPWVVHRNPKLWDAPETFDPERFSLQNTRGREPFAYLAFSAGMRNCVGQPFVFVEVKAILAMVLKRYRLRVDPASVNLKLATDTVTWPASEMLMTVDARA